MAGYQDGAVWMWSLPSGQVLQVLASEGFSATSGLFTPDGKAQMCWSVAPHGSLGPQGNGLSRETRKVSSRYGTRRLPKSR
jgi:hypothetical protein